MWQGCGQDSASTGCGQGWLGSRFEGKLVQCPWVRSADRAHFWPPINVISALKAEAFHEQIHSFWCYSQSVGCGRTGHNVRLQNHVWTGPWAWWQSGPGHTVPRLPSLRLHFPSLVFPSRLSHSDQLFLLHSICFLRTPGFLTHIQVLMPPADMTESLSVAPQVALSFDSKK